MCWNIAVVFRQQKRRKVQYEVCKLYPDTSLEEPSRRTDDCRAESAHCGIDRIEVFNDERVKIYFTFEDTLNGYEEK